MIWAAVAVAIGIWPWALPLAGLFFLSGFVIVRLAPNVYLPPGVKSGNEAALAHWSVLEKLVMQAHERGMKAVTTVIPPLTGSRHWYDLTGPQQDEYLLSCFKGENARRGVESKFDIYDRVAGSIAHFLLDSYLGFEPADDREAFAVQVRRILNLKNTLLGERLIKAIGRRELIESEGVAPEDFDYSQDPMLFFEHLELFAKTRGFEMLSFDCIKKFDAEQK